MSETKVERISENSIARIAGNLLSGMNLPVADPVVAAQYAVAQARAIAAEVERTRPAAQTEDGK